MYLWNGRCFVICLVSRPDTVIHLPIRHCGAGALPAASGDSASTAAGGEAAEPRHHASAQCSQPHTGENTCCLFVDNFPE